MSNCEICKKEIFKSDGCSIDTVSIDGKIYDRIKFGYECENLIEEKPEDFRCRDCGVKVGEYHHWNCGIEKCPACKNQLIGCECKDVCIEEFEDIEESLRYEENRKIIENLKNEITRLETENTVKDKQGDKIVGFLATEKIRIKKR